MLKVYPKGISVIICCFNSRNRLFHTLDALSKQLFSAMPNWEILLIDNGSTDGTADYATEIWAAMNQPCKLSIFTEEQQGLMFARKKGIAMSAYSYILFCDDDNWLANDYVDGMFKILSEQSSVAACGGQGIPVFETAKPNWFDTYQEAFATGHQTSHPPTQPILSLYGAGLAINKYLLDELNASGFQPYFTGRSGAGLSSAEDTELTYAFVIMGYQLAYAAHLTFCHYLPKERLQISYLRKLFTAFGKDGPVRNLYHANASGNRLLRNNSNWYYHFSLCIGRTLKYLIYPPKKNARTIYLQWSSAYLTELFRIRNNYASIKRNIQKLTIAR
jgi:glycosyltransferase involved in cell wall biosynthesis